MLADSGRPIPDVRERRLHTGAVDEHALIKAGNGPSRRSTGSTRRVLDHSSTCRRRDSQRYARPFGESLVSLRRRHVEKNVDLKLFLREEVTIPEARVAVPESARADTFHDNGVRRVLAMALQRATPSRLS